MIMLSNSQPGPPIKSVTAVKGHLVTKSSALATSNCKLEKQFLTAQNMASHYKRVINARKTIDNAPPRSMVASQKARDRAKREMINSGLTSRSTSRAQSADPLRNSQISLQGDKPSFRQSQISVRDTKSATTPTPAKPYSNSNQIPVKPRVLPDQVKLNKSMANLMTNFTAVNNKNRVLTYRPSSSNANSNINLRESGDFVQKNTNPLLNTQYFSTEQKNKIALNTLLFSTKEPEMSKMMHPALKAMSKLVAGHSYDVLELHKDKFKSPSKEFEPRIKNREKTKSSLLENGSCYQAPRLKKKLSSAQSTTRSVNTNNETLENSTNQKIEENIPNEQSIVEDINRSQNQSYNSIKKNEIKYKNSMEKEEELKYLEFIKNVTDDIIARGISSNQAINNCFENHIKRNKSHLNENKMRELLNTLRIDIGVPNEKNEQSHLGGNFNRSANRSLVLDRGDDDYLTLEKLGLQNYDKKNDSNINLNESGNNVWKQLDTAYILDTPILTSSRRESNNSNITKQVNLVDEYENKIIKNIQSIRRNSLSSSSSPPLKSGEQSRHDSNASNGSIKQTSILKKSPTNSNQSLNKSNRYDEDDDDNDVFLSEFKPAIKKNSIPDVAQKRRSSVGEISNVSRNLTVISKEDADYYNDALLNDNYGSTEEDESDQQRTKNSTKPKPIIKQGSNESGNQEYEDNFDEEEDHTDKFNKLLQTKSFQKKMQEDDSENDYDRYDDYEDGEEIKSHETPRPAPRKLSKEINYKKSAGVYSSEEDN